MKNLILVALVFILSCGVEKIPSEILELGLKNEFLKALEHV